MYIASVRIRNYKSFYASEEILLTPGFNVVVGKNNAGKTAFAEALSFQGGDKPHRSLKTAPNRSARLAPTSHLDVSLCLGRDEFMEFLSHLNHIFVPLRAKDRAPQNLDALKERVAEFREAISEENVLKCVFHSGNQLESAYLLAYGDVPRDRQDQKVTVLEVRVDSSGRDLRLERENTTANNYVSTFAMQIGNKLWRRVYAFNAERFNISEGPIRVEPILQSNARNLAGVLHLLQSSNPSRFRRLVGLVRVVFPEIKEITVPPIASDQAHILVWSIDPKSERDDLAMSLSESGTGIGQVLAILYVILTSDHPMVIIIDEPQSFLHPGAVRKLLSILRQHPEHQYILTTHSPTVIASAGSKAFHLIRKQEAESVVETVDVSEAQELQMLLSEVGARLSDVFGADNILWVEGRTEEECFRLIASKMLDQPLLGTEILGVVGTGDFEAKRRKDPKTVLEIYKRLSTGSALLPRAIGFIFDREGRSNKECEDLRLLFGDVVNFIPRKMYENYLFNPRAIASVMSDIEGFRDSVITAEEVEEWLDRHRWEREYFERKVSEGKQTDGEWVKSVDGAKVLEDIFDELSAPGFYYDKIEQGVALTEWLIENAPEDLAEIVELIKQALSNKPSVMPN